MSETVEKKRPDLKQMFEEELNFSTKMFFAPVMAIVHEVVERWRDLNIEVEKAAPETRKDRRDRG